MLAPFLGLNRTAVPTDLLERTLATDVVQRSDIAHRRT